MSLALLAFYLIRDESVVGYHMYPPSAFPLYIKYKETMS